MFHYIRLFSYVACALVIAGAIMLGSYFRNESADNLKTLVQSSNESMVNSFVYTVWEPRRMPEILKQFQTYKVAPAQWPQYKPFYQFSQVANQFLGRAIMVQANIYAKDGTQILSVTPGALSGDTASQVRMNDAQMQEKRRRFAQAVNGAQSSAIATGSQFPTLINPHAEGVLVHSYVPIFSKDYVPQLSGGANAEKYVQAVVEVYVDVTPQWSRLDRFGYVGMGAIATLFLLILGLLWIFANKAEVIIAKQYESNVELASQAAAAEAESRNKSLFLANVSHELRTPLNSIIGFSEIMMNELMGQFENSQYLDYIKDIHGSGKHLLSLINDILDFSKAEAGKLDLQLEEVDVTKVVRNSIRLIQPRAETAKVNIVEEIPREHFVLTTDAKKLKQIMLNLLSNAVKFTNENGSVKVSMWKNMADGAVMIEVKDSGIGIAAKDIARAMSPFGQVDNALSRKYEGTGLGLPLTKKFVELMGGKFVIESEEGVGTTIRFSLPKESPKIKDPRAQKDQEKVKAQAAANMPKPTAEKAPAKEAPKPVEPPQQNVPKEAPQAPAKPDVAPPPAPPAPEAPKAPPAAPVNQAAPAINPAVAAAPAAFVPPPEEKPATKQAPAEEAPKEPMMAPPPPPREPSPAAEPPQKEPMMAPPPPPREPSAAQPDEGKTPMMAPPPPPREPLPTDKNHDETPKEPMMAPPPPPREPEGE